MSKRRGGLGSGLDALLPAATSNTDSSSSTREVPIGDVRPNRYQPRKTFDDQAIADLSLSIQEHGIVQPLLVTRLPSGGYELIAGERRLRAAIKAGLTSVPVVIRESTPQEMLEIAIIENVQRSDLNPIEEALAYQSLKDEFLLSDEQIAKRMGRASRVQITNTRRLLRLSDEVQQALRAGQISAGHGRSILKYEEHDRQRELLDVVMSAGMTVRETEQITDVDHATAHTMSAHLAEIRTKQAPKPTKPVITNPSRQSGGDTTLVSSDDHAVARELESHIGTPVHIQRTARDVRLTFVFHSDEKLQEFLDALNQA